MKEEMAMFTKDLLAAMQIMKLDGFTAYEFNKDTRPFGFTAIKFNREGIVDVLKNEGYAVIKKSNTVVIHFPKQQKLA